MVNMKYVPPAGIVTTSADGIAAWTAVAMPNVAPAIRKRNQHAERLAVTPHEIPPAIGPDRAAPTGAARTLCEINRDTEDFYLAITVAVLETLLPFASPIVRKTLYSPFALALVIGTLKDTQPSTLIVAVGCTTATFLPR